MSTSHGVIGTDGIQPVYDPDGLWKWWGYHEIYTGTVGQGKYVPKVNDYVVDPGNFTVYIVDHLDPVTLIPTLREVRVQTSGAFTETDLLIGVGPGTQSDTYRVYYDKSVYPYKLQVDTRLKVAGTMTRYCKIFKGSDLGGSGTVISKVYDSSGNFVSENVALELAAIDSHDNHSIKIVAVCHTTEELADGEIVTAVFYSDTGHVVSKRQLLIENTTFIRSINVSTKYVTHISLESPFLSVADDHLLEWPLNINMNALNLMAKVHYSNGESIRLPVDGTKFSMDGLDHHLSSIVGQRADLSLRYSLSPNEVAYASVGVDTYAVTEPYSIVTVNANMSYELKLYVYPEWVGMEAGYRLRWWLLNLDRNVAFDATPYVSIDPLFGAYDPKAYGYLQKKQVSVNLRDVSAAFKNFRHTQIVDISLMSPPDPIVTSWTVSHESHSTRPAYGIDVFAKRVYSTTLNVSSGFTDKEDWMEHVFYRTYPLINNTRELRPPEPTHFVVMLGGTEQEFAIEDWNKDIITAMALTPYSIVYLKFIKKTPTGNLILSVSGMMIRP